MNVFVVWVCCLVAHTLVAQANHYLAAISWLHVHFYIGGLMVTFAALRLPYSAGCKVAALTGLFLDAPAALPVGTQAVLFVAAHAFIYVARTRFPRDETLVGTAVALVANAAVYLCLCVALIPRNPAAGSIWLRMVSDLCLSELLIIVVAPWFFALQTQALEISGISLRRDQRGLG